MIALSCALVVVAALGAFVARGYFAMRLQLAKPSDQHDAALAKLDERLRALEGLADRVQELESSRAEYEERIVGTGVELGEGLEKARQKYDAIITNGLNEMRQMLEPLRREMFEAQRRRDQMQRGN